MARAPFIFEVLGSSLNVVFDIFYVLGKHTKVVTNVTQHIDKRREIEVELHYRGFEQQNRLRNN
jgi:hypothetical protein